MSLTRSVIQPPFDIDAQRFIYATGITNFTQKRAINYLVQGLKQNNLWSKMSAIYPMVGGTAWTCKFNLVNPRDSDLAFRLSFVANPTISNQGVGWNGTSQYANTFFIPNTSATLNSAHLSYYSRTNAAEASYDIGTTDGTNNRHSYIESRSAGDNTTVTLNGINTAFVNVANVDSRGLFVVSRVNSTQIINAKNGVSTTGAASSSALSTTSYLVAARNVGTTPGSVLASGFSTKQCAFSSIGLGLTTTDIFNFYNIVQQFQIILGRQV